MEFGTKNGKTSKLLIGDNTPAGSAVYAKLDGDPRLFTMGTYSKTAFDKEAKDLRDKRLLPFYTSQIEPDRDHRSEANLRVRQERRERMANREAQGHACGQRADGTIWFDN